MAKIIVLSCNFLLVFWCFTSASALNASEQALHECTNIHKLPFASIPNAAGRFLNSGCRLECSVGGTNSLVLSSNPMNEAFPCPNDSTGVCQAGECIHHANHEAVRACGNLLHQDWLTANTKGTEFVNETCAVRCVKQGQVVMESPLNEGYHCSGHTDRICKSGQCIEAPKTVPTTVAPSDIKQKSFLETHKIVIVDVTMRAAKIDQTYANLSGALCLRTLKYDASKPRCMRECQTIRHPELTSSPVFAPKSLGNPCRLWDVPFRSDDIFDFSLLQLVGETVVTIHEQTISTLSFPLVPMIQQQLHDHPDKLTNPNNIDTLLTFTQNSSFVRDQRTVGWFLADFQVTFIPA